IAVAHVLQTKGLVAKTLRSVVLFPQMISMVAVAVMWMFIFNPQYGLITSFLKGLGLDGTGKGLFAPLIGSERLSHINLVHTWLGEPKTALSSVGVALIWY